MFTNHLTYQTFTVLLTVIYWTRKGSAQSCLGRCCVGANSSCYSIDSTSGKRCFCDRHCLRSNDCCHDYTSLCTLEPPINCVLSNWRRWTHCSRKCGSGLQKRSRSVIISPNSSGQKCGNLTDTRQCRGVLCPVQSQSYKQRKTHNYWKSTAAVVQIVPDLKNTALLYRRYSHKHGIRRHMYLRDLWLRNATEKETIKKPYCTYYQITMVLGKCQNLHKLTTLERANWIEHAMYLTESSTVCVTCYPQTQQNQCAGFSNQKESRWRAVRSDNCHGFFRLTSRKQQCKCPQPSFLMI